MQQKVGPKTRTVKALTVFLIVLALLLPLLYHETSPKRRVKVSADTRGRSCTAKTVNSGIENV